MSLLLQAIIAQRGITGPTGPTGAGDNTLDLAYDEGGPGVGREITVDSGSVLLTGEQTTDQQSVLEITLNFDPAGSDYEGKGLWMTINNDVASTTPITTFAGQYIEVIQKGDTGADIEYMLGIDLVMQNDGAAAITEAAIGYNVEWDLTGSGHIACQARAYNVGSFVDTGSGSFQSGIYGYYCEDISGISTEGVYAFYYEGSSEGEEVVVEGLNSRIGIGVASPNYRLDVLESNTAETGNLLMTNFIFEANPAGDGDGVFISGNFIAKTENSLAYDVAELTGLFSAGQLVGSGDCDLVRGGLFLGISSGTGTAVALTGFSTGILNLNGLGTVTEAKGINIGSPTNAGTMTTYYGLYINSASTGGTMWSIYSEGNNNYFGGNLSVGTTTTDSAVVHIDQSSSSGNIPVLLLDQADNDKEFINFTGVSANNQLGYSLVEKADTGIDTLIGYYKIYVNDVGNQITDTIYYVPFYTLNAP